MDIESYCNKNGRYTIDYYYMCYDISFQSAGAPRIDWLILGATKHVGQKTGIVLCFGFWCFWPILGGLTNSEFDCTSVH